MKKKLNTLINLRDQDKGLKYYKDRSERLLNMINTEYKPTITEQEKTIQEQREQLETYQKKIQELYGVWEDFENMKVSLRIVKATLEQHIGQDCSLQGIINDYPQYVCDMIKTILNEKENK